MLVSSLNQMMDLYRRKDKTFSLSSEKYWKSTNTRQINRRQDTQMYSHGWRQSEWLTHHTVRHRWIDNLLLRRKGDRGVWMILGGSKWLLGGFNGLEEQTNNDLGQSLLSPSSKQLFVTKIYPGILTDFSLSSFNVCFTNENSGKGPAVIVSFFGRSRL